MEKAKDLLIKTGRIAVKVTPRARTEGLEEMSPTGELIIKTRAVAENGKANEAVIRLLAEAFGLRKSQLVITHGTTSRHKVIALKHE